MPKGRGIQGRPREAGVRISRSPQQGDDSGARSRRPVGRSLRRLQQNAADWSPGVRSVWCQGSGGREPRPGCGRAVPGAWGPLSQAPPPSCQRGGRSRLPGLWQRRPDRCPVISLCVGDKALLSVRTSVR